MKLTIEFNTDNSAFKDINGDTDPNAVLYQLKKEFQKVENHLAYDQPLTKVKDMNGNTVGTVSVEL